jgi:pyrrolidone-carboxylate peptidase
VTLNRTLITYFGPFKQFQENPAELVANKLQILFKKDATIEFKRLEVSYQSIDQFLETDLNHYDTIIELGVATKSEIIRLELFGRNFVNGFDNNAVSKDGAINTNGKTVVKTNFSESFLDQIITIYPDSVSKSESAGKYLCNYLYYQSMNKFSEKNILFIHLANFIDIPHALSLDEQVEIIANILKKYNKEYLRNLS